MSRNSVAKSFYLKQFDYKQCSRWISGIVLTVFVLSIFFPTMSGTADVVDSPNTQMETFCYEDICLSFEQSQLGFVEAYRVEEKQIAGLPIPGHIEFWFYRYKIQSPDNYYGVIEFYSTDEVSVSEIERTLSNQPYTSPSIYENIQGISRLPFPDGNAMLTMVANFRYLDFYSGSGYRYIGHYGQAVAPIRPEELIYIYQGVSNDGGYAVSARINNRLIDSSLSPPSDGGGDDETEDRNYNQQLAELVEQTPDDGFSPDLSVLDAVIESITIGPPIDISISSSFDPVEASEWLDEKRQLAINLQKVYIPTRLFTIPGLSAYDETAALQLVDHLSSQLDMEMMSLDDFERIKRLTIQERALTGILPAYVETTSTVAKSSVDMIKTTLSFNKTMDMVWKSCDRTICSKVNQQTNKIYWRLLRTFGKQFIQAGADKIDSPEAMSKIWDVGLKMVEDKVEHNGTLKDMLIDNAMDGLFTSVMIKPYLNRTQKMLEYGVASADSSIAWGYSITADSGRAISLTEELVQKAVWESDLAVSRYEDFSRAADLAQLAIDISDLGSLANPIFGSVSLFARMEKLAVNYVLVGVNVDNIGCVEYLASRAAELAFDAQLRPDDCRYWRASRIPLSGSIKISYPYPSQPQSYLHKAVLQNSAAYRRSLEELRSALDRGDIDSAEAGLDNFMAVEQQLWESLNNSRSILWLQDQPTLGGIEFVSQSAGYEAIQMALLSAIAENVIALEDGKLPESNLAEIAEMALVRLDTVEQAEQRVDLNPPAGKPVIVIQEARANPPDAGIFTAEITLANVGDMNANTIDIVLEGGAMPINQTSYLNAGEERSVSITAYLVDLSYFTVKVYWNGELQDVGYLIVPRSEAEPESQTLKPAEPKQSQPAKRPLDSGSVFCWSIGGLAILWLALTVFFAVRKNRH